MRWGKQLLNPLLESGTLWSIRIAAVATPMQSDLATTPTVRGMLNANDDFIRVATAVLRRAGAIPNG